MVFLWLVITVSGITAGHNWAWDDQLIRLQVKMISVNLSDMAEFIPIVQNRPRSDLGRFARLRRGTAVWWWIHAVFWAKTVWSAKGVWYNVGIAIIPYPLFITLATGYKPSPAWVVYGCYTHLNLQMFKSCVSLRFIFSTCISRSKIKMEDCRALTALLVEGGRSVGCCVHWRSSIQWTQEWLVSY